MPDGLQQISLLYELSVSTLKNFDLADTAESFVKKFLSRKNLNYGAIWLFEKTDDHFIHCSKLYSMPSDESDAKIPIENLGIFFSDKNIFSANHSVFYQSDKEGYFAYCKLGDIGLLELYSKKSDEKLSYKALYPFNDVFNQLAVSLESALSYQNLQKEIQQRRHAEKSLQHNQDKYRRIVDNIKLGLLEVDNEEVIQYANDSFCELVEYELSEIVGEKASDLFLYEKDIEMMKEQTLRRQEGTSSAYKIAIKTKSGTEKWGIISGAPNYDINGNQIGSIGIHLDITDQVKLASENAFHESKLKNLFEVSLDALISIDDKGKIIEWNPQAEDIFQYKREEVMGLTLQDTIIPHAFRDAHQSGMNNFHSTGKGPVLNTRIEISALRKSGEEFPIELTIFPIKQNDTHFFTAFVRDITEIKSSREAMNNALKKQTELIQMQSQFVSMTSHELRTPLTTISTDVELMDYYLENNDTVQKDKFRKIITRIDTNVERLNQLINNILIVGQLDSRKVPFSPKSIDILQIIKSKVLENYSTKERAIRLDILGDSYKVSVDVKLFIHIIDNLVSNAFKYSEGKDSPHMKIIFDEEEVSISVKDHGIGIPENDLKKLFSSFFRASNVGSIQGSGLGLSIVREFVLLHKGEISVKSIVNVGTTFTVKFPKN